MIDFNIVLNGLLDQVITLASKPLIERIEQLEAKLAEVQTPSPEALHDAVLEAMGTDKFDDLVRTIVDDKVDEHERRWDHDDFMDHRGVRDAVRDLEFTVSVN